MPPSKSRKEKSKENLSSLRRPKKHWMPRKLLKTKKIDLTRSKNLEQLHKYLNLEAPPLLAMWRDQKPHSPTSICLIRCHQTTKKMITETRLLSRMQRTWKDMKAKKMRWRILRWITLKFVTTYQIRSKSLPWKQRRKDRVLIRRLGRKSMSSN